MKSVKNNVNNEELENSSKVSSPRQNPSGDNIEDLFEQFNINSDNRTNLIVNYLPPNMSQEEVRALFSSIGDVESCKLVRDKVTGESLGYSFVKFTYGLDADKAIRTLNGLRLQHKTIKVSLARPSSESIKGANLYICGLPKKMAQGDLERLFHDAGKIITARILYDNKTGLSRGVAFIRFDQKGEAEAAIEKFNGHILEGSSEAITVKFANCPGTARTDGGPMSMPMGIPSPFMKQSSNHMTSGNNSPAPSSSSPPNRSNIVSPLKQMTPMARLKYVNSIDRMFPSMNMSSNASSLMAPALAASTGALTASGWCIFVYNLSPETADAVLWQLFGPFGAVQSVKVIHEPETGKCKGFGFVTMSNYEEALLAIQSLNGFNMGSRVLQVSFKTTPNIKMRPNAESSSSSPVPSHASQMHHGAPQHA